MLSLFSFFKKQTQEFKQDNKHRSADYIAGGVGALREAVDSLTTQKDVVDLEWVTSQLHAQEKEARELRARNKALNEARRSFQSRCELQAKELANIKEKLAKPQKGPPARLKKENSSLAGEVGSLRHRVKELEHLLAQEGITAPPHILNLQHTILSLKKELDRERGIIRVGQHATGLGHVLKAIKRVLKYEGNSPEISLAYVRRIVENSEAVIEGREPTNEPLAPAPTTPATEQGSPATPTKQEGNGQR